MITRTMKRFARKSVIFELFKAIRAEQYNSWRRRVVRMVAANQISPASADRLLDLNEVIQFYSPLQSQAGQES